MKNILFLLVSIITIQIFYGCLFYRSTEYHDPLAYMLPYYFEKYEKADEYCFNFNEKFKGTKLRQDDNLKKKIDLIFSDVELAYEQLDKANLFSSLYEKDTITITGMRIRNLCPPISINIYALCNPLSVSFPNGEIHLSRAFLESDSPFGAKNIAQLTGLIAHEFIHIRHRHVQHQWAVASAFNEFKKTQWMVNWTKILELLPISYSMTIYSTKNLSKIYFIDYNIECMADFYTAMIMFQIGYNIEEYINLLVNLKEFLNSQDNPNKRKIKELDFRIYSLRGLTTAENFKLLEYLIIERKDVVDNNPASEYVKYSLQQYPIFRKFVVYWSHALLTMGKSAYYSDFAFYEDNSVAPINSVKLNTTTGHLMKPLEVKNCIVLPEKIIEMPLFPFVYKR